CKQALEFPFTF
nr:immunoglobulin light chain junction region [Macaca mulatta]MOX08431.1 immunoglobulin light chain junction region [Macaca mulatta]MOX08910.1 immunoglobulin light chain junction region [Macaca mulatta]MOX08919.1 immunoglobulin light chain junction region [Macaca mulatta]MOX09782.1 immunoglobulin light chain junction region [Macaca mulatta]